MIKEIRLKNFRNFDDVSISFNEDKNIIVGENGKGKTNVLEAISLISNNSITGLDFDSLTKIGCDYFYIEATDKNGAKMSIYYDKSTKKKKYSIENKAVSRKKLSEGSYKSVFFSPIVMNMMYLSPTLRRDFLDGILRNTYIEYDQILKDYKKIVTNRNKVLKNIFEGNSGKTEIAFWNKKLVEKGILVYEYRFKIIDYISKHISKLEVYFGGKINSIIFEYKTKVSRDLAKHDMEKYLEKNLDRDVILKKTYIGPHLDDFDILVDDKSLSTYASRGETKSIIIGLKILEIKFIRKISGKHPVLLIDDLFSELDDNHKNTLLKKIKDYQTFISSISREDKEFNIKI